MRPPMGKLTRRVSKDGMRDGDGGTDDCRGGNRRDSSKPLCLRFDESFSSQDVEGEGRNGGGIGPL